MTPSNPDYASSLIGQQLGDYRIEGVLGRGGMGAVLRGRDLKLDRDVALKVIGQAFGGQAGEAYQAARDRFIREAKTLAGLQHPNLIHLYAVGEIEGKHYFAMELVRGPTLGQWIERFGPLRSAAAVRFTAQMLSALSTVHATGYVHRDIKPGNIMLDCTARLGGRKDNQVPILAQLTGDEAQTGRWVLMDFGLAKLTLDGPESALTQQGLILGTPDTMSPEQAQGLETTAVSDLYSFGVVLYLTLTGKLPFSAPSALGVMQKHLFETAPGLEKHWPEAPVVWREVVAKSLQKEARARFQAEWEIAAALVGRVDELPDLRELAKPPQAAATGATQWTGVKDGTTAIVESAPNTSAAVVDAPTSARAVAVGAVGAVAVSPTDVTIRDARPVAKADGAGEGNTAAAVAQPAPVAPVAPVGGQTPQGKTIEGRPAAGKGAGKAATKPATKAGAQAGTKAASAPQAENLVGDSNGKKTAGGKKGTSGTVAIVNVPPPVTRSKRRVWLGLVAGLVFVFAAGWLLWSYMTPPPLQLRPPPALEPIPVNAFWGDDPAHPGKKIAIHWVGMDPVQQMYQIEVYDETKKAWEEQALNHEQMMKYGELHKPAADDPAFPRAVAAASKEAAQ